MTLVTVQKANVVMDIKESEVDRYLDLGYDIIDHKGNIIKKSIPTDLNTLRAEYITLMDINTKLTELNAKLKKEIKELKAK